MMRHVGLPALAPAAIVALYLTPVQTFGCFVRGLMAFRVVLASGVAAIVTSALALRARVRGTTGTWWLLSTLILVLPIALVLGPLG
jgi:hypothetical protein